MGGHEMTKHILVPINKSPQSRQILPFVEKLFSPGETRLLLFFLVKPPRGIGLDEADFRPDYQLQPTGAPAVPQERPIFPSQQEDSIQAEVIRELLPTTNALKGKGYDVTVVVDFGQDTVAEIVRAVQQNGIDLVAMSTTAREGVMRFFFGDLANAVLRRVNVPVMLFHPEMDKK